MKIKQSHLDSSVQCSYEYSVSQIDSTCFKLRCCNVLLLQTISFIQL